jgi:hypothetical protein
MTRNPEFIRPAVMHKLCFGKLLVSSRLERGRSLVPLLIPEPVERSSGFSEYSQASGVTELRPGDGSLPVRSRYGPRLRPLRFCDPAPVVKEVP